MTTSCFCHLTVYPGDYFLFRVLPHVLCNCTEFHRGEVPLFIDSEGRGALMSALPTKLKSLTTALKPFPLPENMSAQFLPTYLQGFLSL